MSGLVDQYYAMPEPGARRLFMAAHPELQGYFLEQRTKRYERFMGQVARYMGANPGMFEQYLERQEDILAELLRRYAEMPLAAERVTAQADRSTAAEGGRRRAAA